MMDIDTMDEAERAASLLASQLGDGWHPWTSKNNGYGARFVAEMHLVTVRALLPETHREGLLFLATILDGNVEAIHEDPRVAVRNAYRLLRIYIGRLEQTAREIRMKMPWIEETSGG